MSIRDTITATAAAAVTAARSMIKVGPCLHPCMRTYIYIYIYVCVFLINKIRSGCVHTCEHTRALGAKGEHSRTTLSGSSVVSSGRHRPEAEPPGMQKAETDECANVCVTTECSKSDRMRSAVVAQAETLKLSRVWHSKTFLSTPELGHVPEWRVGSSSRQASEEASND